MLRWLQGLSPLHGAVIDDNHHAVEELAQSQWTTSRDRLGFTPLDLARFLGRRACVALLGGPMPFRVALQRKGEQSPRPCTMEEFESYFGLVYRPWLTFPTYTALRKVVHQCPYLLRSQKLTPENYAWAQEYQPLLASGATAPVSVRWTNQEIGYGLFADEPLPINTYIGEYTGIVRRLYRLHHDENPYCFHYPSRFWSYDVHTIDASRQGNALRFINHHSNPNLTPRCAVDRNILHMVFVTNAHVPKNSQLTFNYGPDYWS